MTGQPGARGQVDRRLAPGPGRRRDAAEDWLLQRAEAALDRGDLDTAIPHLERLAGLARDREVRGHAHLTLGEIRRQREELPRAVQHLRAAADCCPQRPEFHYQLGLALAAQENARAAIEALRRAAALAPADAEVARALGVALAAVGEDLEADELLRRAHDHAPDDLHVMESLAMHHLKMGRFAACGTVVERATRLAPDNPVVRKLAKEASYLVERAASGPPVARPHRAGRGRLRLALTGAAARVEQRFLRSMRAAGFVERQCENARDLWRDFLKVRGGRVRGEAEHAAAVELVMARLDFVEGCPRDEVARRHGVGDAALRRTHDDLAAALELAVFDRRYSTHPSPIDDVIKGDGEEMLGPEEVFQVLLEDEYREYSAAHGRLGCSEPLLDRDEFEDASVEYGCLLTRELMGITLGRRERRRKRDLERLLLVTA